MQLTQPIEPEELADLGRRFGTVSYQHELLAVTDPFLTESHQRLLTDGRRAEICYVMHRGVPAHGILLHHKAFYPGPAFRLPTGGVDPGETVWDTLVREIYEETGLIVKTGEDGAGDVVVEDFLGVVSYGFHHQRLDQHFSFATYHFLV
ncbi:MAG: NUDIX hydrolase, partial [Caldilineaceae bacterium]|nr:NUDIX hydrolase [Caldilineaceae bacterium]